MRFFVLLFVVVAVVSFNVVIGFRSLTPRSSTTCRSRTTAGRFVVNLSPNDNEDYNKDNDVEELDWRDVRAKLVMQYRAEDGRDLQQRHDQQHSDVAEFNHSDNKGWVYEAGDAIETGSLIVSAPSQDFSCGGLKQQYFYKSCVLIVEHNSRIFTRGLLMNRPTDRTVKDEHGNDWKVRYGGPMQGLDSDDVSFFCLHRLTGSGSSSHTRTKESTTRDDNNVKSTLTDLSVPINKDIAMTKWDTAQALVAAGEATIDDFILVAGYSGWNPGQLEDELHRNDWYAVALDADSIFDMIKRQDESSIPTGTDMWVQIMTKIGKGSMTSYTFKNKASVRFQDKMLQQFVRQRLAVSKTRYVDDAVEDLAGASDRQPFYLLPPGTLVRATSPILLDDQVFHKSLVLIVENNEELMAGVVLNRPSSKSITVNDKELPIRYGGSFGIPGKGRPIMWLHCNNEKLQEAQVGEPLFPVREETQRPCMFWKCSQEDAETAVEIGLASPDDFFVTKGLSMWKRRNMEDASKQDKSIVDFDECFNEIDRGAIPTVWKLLSTQEPLNKKNAAENLETANAAWLIAGDASWLLSGSRSNASQEHQAVQNLANSALDRWIRTFLL
jgi:putative AlgH/UPF0301 family transcriptional regulator